ncbi:MAG: RNA polymerase sigma factor [Planctomycetota bacterium]
MTEAEPAATLRAASAGDPAAWRRLIESYSGRVYGLLVQQCGDRDLAEELTQVTFVKLVDQLGQAAGGYREQGRFEAWLFRIAMNKLRDEMRRRKRQARPTDMTPGSGRGDPSPGGGGGQIFAAPADEGDLGEDPAEALGRAEQVHRLRRVIATLPEADREVLHLRHTAGLSFAQIAETLDQPLGTVLARGHRALKKLKTQMLEKS